MDKGFKSEGKFEIRSNKYFPGMTGEWSFETADSMIDVLATLPTTIISVSRGLMQVFTETEEKRLELQRQRKQADNEVELQSLKQHNVNLQKEIERLNELKAKKTSTAMNKSEEKPSEANLSQISIKQAQPCCSYA